MAPASRSASSPGHAHEVVREALGRLGPYAGQLVELLDELSDGLGGRVSACGHELRPPRGLCLVYGAHQRRGLVHSLLVLAHGGAVVYHSPARLHVGHAVLHDHGADGDGGVHVALEVEVSDGAGVGAALVGLQLGDYLHGADLGGAGDGAGGEASPEHVVAGVAALELAGYVGDEVHDVGVALDVHELGYLYGAGQADAAYVVAPEVDEHDVFGALLLVGAQVGLQLQVLSGRVASGARAGDRVGGYLAVLDLDEQLGGGADDLETVQLQVVHVRRRVDGAEGAVDLEGVG